MNSLGFATFLVALAVAHAGLLAGAPIDSAAVVTGPSGQVVRSGVAAVASPLVAPLAARVGLSAPIVAARAAPLAVAAAAPVAVAAPVISQRAAQLGLQLSVPAGSGLEGQWIPDINERLYDDGSYKPYIYGL